MERVMRYCGHDPSEKVPLYCQRSLLQTELNVTHIMVSDRDGPFLLFIGLVCLIVSVISAVSGQVLTRFGMILRAEEPNRYWWAVGMSFLGGLFLIGLYFYQNPKCDHLPGIGCACFHAARRLESGFTHETQL